MNASELVLLGTTLLEALIRLQSTLGRAAAEGRDVTDEEKALVRAGVDAARQRFVDSEPN